ncbi:MAG: hypothetical protein R3B67_02880 [Phycisphaerales bacterium]
MGSSMEDWILVLLIISTVLACWGFCCCSGCSREFIARKRKRLRAEHQRRGVVFALIAMAELVLCHRLGLGRGRSDTDDERG